MVAGPRGLRREFAGLLVVVVGLVGFRKEALGSVLVERDGNRQGRTGARSRPLKIFVLEMNCIRFLNC